MQSSEASDIRLEQIGYEEFVFPDGSFRFAVLKTFRLFASVSEATGHVVAELLTQREYRDDYQAPGEASLTSEPVHGPYRLDALSPTSFVPVTAAEAEELLDGWLDEDEQYAWEGPGADEANARHIAGKPAVRAWFDQKRELFKVGEILHLPTLDETSQHESGWTLWQFSEWLILDRERGRVSVLSVALD